MHINTKGQVTIPIAVREKFNLLPNTEVEFVEYENYITLVKRESSNRRGANIIKALKNRGDVDMGMTTDEIMTLMRGS